MIHVKIIPNEQETSHFFFLVRVEAEILTFFVGTVSVLFVDEATDEVIFSMISLDSLV
jgi:hypothetical protein